MKASKSQIAEITTVANQMNVSMSQVLNTLANCSVSIYNVIGAKGLVESSIKANTRIEASQNGGLLFADCVIVKTSEKAYLLQLPAGTEKWIAKSIIKEINGNTIIPFWALKN
jgi:hypothetical protein